MSTTPKRRPYTPPIDMNPLGPDHSRIPPNALELEDAILGALLLEKDALDDVTLILRKEMFYKLEHQFIYAAIEALHLDGKPVDILTVTSFLKQSGHLEAVGGPYYVSKLTDRVAGSANAEYHARIVQQKFFQRELIRVSGNFYEEAFDDTGDVLELLDRANSEIASIGSELSEEGQSRTNAQILAEVIANAELAAKGGNVTGLSSDIPEADRMTGGWEEGKAYIVAARPAMGKSSYAMQAAKHIALDLGKTVPFFSLEMSENELMTRLLSVQTGIDSNDIKNGRLDADQWAKVIEARNVLADAPVHIIDNLTSLSSILKKCRILKKRGNLGAIFIDYLQLVKNREAGNNREQEISSISRAFKSIAKELRVPVIALSQLSRAVETRGGSKKPMLSDLRESGSLEQDADVVMFLYRPEYYGIEVSDDNIPTQGLTELIIAKNRGGRTGTVPMRFTAHTTSFSPWDDMAAFPKDPFAPKKAQSRSEVPEQPEYRSPLPRSMEFDMDDTDDNPF